MIGNAALVPRIERTIRAQHLFQSGDTLIVALSGGADSAALLDLLSRLPGYTLHLIVAHLNHCLRGVESDTDEDFCRELASRYAVPFEVRRIDIKKMAEENRLNLEDAGRRARIHFFDEICGQYGATAVVLAHHADDQAETVLMRLLRGSGMTGLSGMAYRNARGYIRPLLDISRSEIEQYLRSQGLNWREDASNSDTTYLRNRIRHELLPLLEEYNPAIRSCLAATASVISGDETLVEELTEHACAGLILMGEGSASCSITSFRTLKPPLQRRVLRHLFEQLADTLEGVCVRHIDAICAMVDSGRPNSRLSLPHSITAVREYDRLIVMKRIEPALDLDFELLIKEPGRYQLPTGGTLNVEVVSASDFPTDSDTICFDFEKIPFPLRVRTFNPGDRITPFGMSGRKKVKDIFIDRKIPTSERPRIPLLFCGDELIWVVGVCASERCRIESLQGNLVKVILQV